LSPSEFDFNPLSPATAIAGCRSHVPSFTRRSGQRPWSRIAKEFGISDRGLAKVCVRLEVPVPPRGHWAKLQAGKPSSKIPLPAPKPMTPQETAIRKTLGSRLLPEPPASRDPELQARIDAALASAQPVRVPRSLSNPHPLIGRWMDEDRLARERVRESFYAPAHLSITRTETDRRRFTCRADSASSTKCF
jgi:hypothetical protein